MSGLKNNGQRMHRIHTLLASGSYVDAEQAQRLAWEWIKTGKFDRTDFEHFLQVWAESWIMKSKENERLRDRAIEVAISASNDAERALREEGLL